MSDYTRVHNFTAKDALTSGDPNKKIKGSEVDAELDAARTAINSKPDDDVVVHLAGTETVTGAKTFSAACTFEGNNTHSGNNTFSGDNTHSGAETFTNDVTVSGARLIGFLRGHIFGLTVSNNSVDSAHDLDIGAGEASSDDTAPVLMRLSSTLTKQLDATFAEGTAAGGFATGESLPTSGTVHLWLIAKEDGTTDVFANDEATSGSSPTLPSGFTYKRILGSRTTDASANIVPTIQDGDDVWLDVTKLDISTTNPGTSAVTATLSSPAGRVLKAKVTVALLDDSPGGETNVLVTSLSQTDTAPTGVLNTFRVKDAGVGVPISENVVMEVLTNSSQQIRYRLSLSSADHIIQILMHGWTDRRGRD